MTDQNLLDQLNVMRGRAYAAETELAHMRALMDENREKVPQAASYLQWKNSRQRAALGRLCRRVVAQRAVLRRLSETGREPTAEDWVEIRKTLTDETNDALVEVGLTPDETHEDQPS